MRPWPWVAGAVALGAASAPANVELAADAVAGGTSVGWEVRAGIWVALAVLLALRLAVAKRPLLRERGTGGARRRTATTVAVLAAVALLAHATVRADRRPPRPLDGSAAVVGTWRETGAGRGRLKLDDGSVVFADLTCPEPAPKAGARVALLPPFERRAAARGPLFGARSGPAPPRVSLALDQVVVLARDGTGGLGAGLLDGMLFDAAAEDGPRTRDARDDGRDDGGWLEELRRAMGARALALPTAPDRPPSGLAPALLVGDRSHLRYDVGDLFTRTGTRHLLALSGLHVGLFALLFALPLRRLIERLACRTRLRRPWPRRAGAVAAAGAVVVFAHLAGASPPVVRASVVAVLVLVAHDWPKGAPRRCDALSLLGLALTLELVQRPDAWRDATVALSFGASMALAAAARPASDLVARLLFGRGLTAGVDSFAWIGPRHRLVAAVVRLRCERAVAWALGTSLVANLGTLPAMWALFGEFSPIGLVATPVVAPLLLLWLPSLWLGALAPGTVLARPQAIVESAMLSVLEWFDRLPGTATLLPERPTWWIAFLCVAALVCLARGLHGTRRPAVRRLWRATFVGWAATLVPWNAPANALEVWALDVGHGTCVVARAPGLPLVVFDAGSTTRFGLEREALRPLLMRLDAGAGLLVLSHTDADHRSSLRWLATRLSWSAVAGAWPRDLATPAPRRTVVDPPGALGGALWGSDDPGGARWTLLRGAPGGGNDGSCDLVLEWRGRRVLLFGDGTGPGLEALLERGLVPTRVDLALLPHHGGFGTGIERWLEDARADEIWVSAERPHDLEHELERRTLVWRATWLDGPLGLELGPGEASRAHASTGG
ncbi:ComEC/Rec2 family competence protein [Rohdeia mirabilis]|uniref:ComEC/Rec2 family competence protein n=1 Tax=Rohdeia mirabilis TaxID=2528008 RepID=UPI003AF3837A